MDKIFIRELAVDCIIGIYAHERAAPQRIYFDISAKFDNKLGAYSEAIDNTVNYHAICTRISNYVSSSEFLLLETLAEAVASIILAEFAVHKVKVSVHKRAVIEDVARVGVCISRSRARNLQLVLVALGSNQDAPKALQSALQHLQHKFGALNCSRFYQNPAVGLVGPDFINAAVSFYSCYSAPLLQTELRAIEAQVDNIDLDLLAVGQQRLKLPQLQLPRPELPSRAYQLAPLNDIAATVLHADSQLSYQQLWQQLQAQHADSCAKLQVVDL